MKISPEKLPGCLIEGVRGDGPLLDREFFQEVVNQINTDQQASSKPKAPAMQHQY